MPAPHQRSIMVLAGPTASGKSALAVNWALRAGALIVNADSMQVYSDLNMLTARPHADDLMKVPHALYGYVDGAIAYSVARWLDDVAGLMAREPERPLLFVGGTGLYIEALIKGLSAVPPVPDHVREHWRARGLVEAAPELHRALQERDPAMAVALRPSDTQRILRALEVWDGTGRSLRDWQAETSQALAPDAQICLLTPDRSELRERIAVRFSAMMEKGALAEVAALQVRKLAPSLPIMKAIGVPPLLAHLDGRRSMEQAIQAAITDSRQYAKRQSTWLRNRLGGRAALPDRALA